MVVRLFQIVSIQACVFFSYIGHNNYEDVFISYNFCFVGKGLQTKDGSSKYSNITTWN